MTETITRKRFTVDDYYKLAEIGVWSEDDHVELIDGEIFEMGPMSCKHARCVLFLNEIVNEMLHHKARIGSQLPVRLNNYYELEPDILVLTPKKDHYHYSPPTAEDVYLLIEVSLSSINIDLKSKLPQYAESGVPEVWVVDLENEVVHQFTEPLGGEYQNHIIHQKNESIQAQQIEGVVLSVNDILGIES